MSHLMSTLVLPGTLAAAGVTGQRAAPSLALRPASYR
jgi:hypothetical protein